jgi:hypothetical protein
LRVRLCRLQAICPSVRKRLRGSGTGAGECNVVIFRAALRGSLADAVSRAIVGPRQVDHAAGGIGVLDEEAGTIVLKAVEISVRIFQAGEQAERCIRQLNRVAERVGDLAQVSISVDRQRGRLPIRRYDSSGMAIGITLDGGDIAAAIGHCDEQAIGIIAKVVEHSSGHRQQGLDVSSKEAVKNIDFTPVFRSEV